MYALLSLQRLMAFVIDQAALVGSWQRYLGTFLQSHTGERQLFHLFDIAFTIERAKHQHAFQYFTEKEHSTLPFYGTLQPVRRYADYLSAVKCISSRSLVSRFRMSCHGLQVDTYWWAKDVDASRGCLVCKLLGCVEDEQHFVFHCPAYSHIGAKHVGHVSALSHCCRLHVFL